MIALLVRAMNDPTLKTYDHILSVVQYARLSGEDDIVRTWEEHLENTRP